HFLPALIQVHLILQAGVGSRHAVGIELVVQRKNHAQRILRVGKRLQVPGLLASNLRLLSDAQPQARHKFQHFSRTRRKSWLCRLRNRRLRHFRSRPVCRRCRRPAGGWRRGRIPVRSERHHRLLAPHVQPPERRRTAQDRPERSAQNHHSPAHADSETSFFTFLLPLTLSSYNTISRQLRNFLGGHRSRCGCSFAWGEGAFRMRFVVTGGAGFIGSNTVDELIRRGHSVVVLDDLSAGKEENLAEVRNKISFIKGSITDLDTVRKAMQEADYVLHLAARTSVPRSVKDPIETNRINVDGTLNVLVAARDAKVKRIVFAASSSAYGETPTLPKVETMQPQPISPYGVTKFVGELYAQTFGRVYGLENVSLRYFNVFGPRQDPNSPYSGVLSKFCTANKANWDPGG